MRVPNHRVVLLASVLLAGACAGNPGPAPMRTVETGWRQEGEASWYGPGFDGKRTASGEVYDMDDLTAAHRALPFGSRIRVVNLDNGLETQVRINDRGPFARGRVLDLSRAAAREIDMLASGTARVRIEVLPPDAPTPTADAPVDQVAIPTSCTLVQVGAYRERRNAAEMVRRLQARGEPVRELQGGDGITRVLLGPYGSEAETRLILERYDGLLKPCGG